MAEDSSLGKERRHYIRLEQTVPVSFTVEGIPGKTFSGNTRNISQGGACIDVEKDTEELAVKLKPHETKLSIKIDIPEVDSEIPDVEQWISGEVYWITPPTRKSPILMLGAEFAPESNPAREMIRAFLVNQFITRYGA